MGRAANGKRRRAKRGSLLHTATDLWTVRKTKSEMILIQNSGGLCQRAQCWQNLIECGGSIVSMLLWGLRAIVLKVSQRLEASHESFTASVKAVSVLRNPLEPDWWGSKRLLDERWSRVAEPLLFEENGRFSDWSVVIVQGYVFFCEEWSLLCSTICALTITVSWAPGERAGWAGANALLLGI